LYEEVDSSRRQPDFYSKAFRRTPVTERAAGRRVPRLDWWTRIVLDQWYCHPATPAPVSETPCSHRLRAFIRPRLKSSSAMKPSPPIVDPNGAADGHTNFGTHKPDGGSRKLL